MFDAVHKHKRLAQVILALLIIPFAFVGVDYYFRTDAQQVPVATVGGKEITRLEYDELLRDQQERMRQAMGRGYDPALFDNPEVRYQLLEQLISQRLLQDKARSEHFRVTDAELARTIGEIEPFKVDGKFSGERYRELLASQQMTPAMFEARLREDLLTAPLQEPLVAANIVARVSGERFLSLLEQKRDVAIATIDAAPFAKDVKVDEAQAKAFYDQNQAAFQTPEQARIEYVLLNLPALLGKETIDPAEVRKQYDANLTAYSKAEERRASHILIAVKPDASEADKAAAKKRAEEIAAQVRAAPAKFAEIAKQRSEDPGSAGQGGDLGAFARGSMVKPFEDAVFAANVGDIVGPVQSDFGFHVIRVAEVSPSRTRSFDEVKGDLEADMKQQKVQARFSQAADQLQNLVYEQADTLAPAAKAIGVDVQTTEFLTRSQIQQLALNNPKFVAALFAPDSLQAKRNSEVIEVGPNALMAGRIVDYKPATPRPFAEVKDEIGRQLVARAASELAQKAGRDKLALLEQGKTDKEAGVTFGKPVGVTRTAPPQDMAPDAVKGIFQADAGKLPSYLGAPNERGGFSIYKLTGVTTPSVDDAERLKTANAQLSQQVGRELMNAYVGSLKGRADVKINQAGLDAK